jgi:carboxypeptidase C (cathepsin A)
MNMLWIDQPAGVGYSTCTGIKDCTFNDETSGKDNLDVILAWYEKYPEFKKNDLWLSGESYGGIYVPYMAYNIDQHNTAHLEDDTVFKPLLKGFAVGNGVTNWKFDTTPAFVDMGYWHSLYDTALYDKI